MPLRSIRIDPQEEVRTKSKDSAKRELSTGGSKWRTPAVPLVSTMIAFLILAGTNARRTLAAVTALLFAVTCMAQDNPQPEPLTPPDSQTSLQASATPPLVTETIPAGTRIALVLTHPIQSRYIHRGDDIYAQITAPITMGNEVIIAPGVLVDGKVDKLVRQRWPCGAASAVHVDHFS